MAKRTIPNIPIYRGRDHELADIFSTIREAVQNIIDTDFVTEKDIYCRDLILSRNSIYIGSKQKKNKLANVDLDLYWGGVKLTDVSSPGVAIHASRHGNGADDELSHDDLTDFVANEHINITTIVCNDGDVITNGGEVVWAS